MTAIIDEMGLDDFTASLAEVITSEIDALRVIGPDSGDASSFYSLLLAFPESGRSGVGEILTDTPILRTKQTFVSPTRAQMPGNFQDPTGYFELIDTTLFPPGMDAFARETLDVEVLSFHTYIDTHLPTILERDLTREQYRAIMSQVVARKNELEDRGSLDRLRNLSFVRTRAGTYVGGEGEGFRIAMMGLDGGRLNIGACSLGGAQRCLDEAITYTKERTQFGQPVAEFQNTQFMLADMATDLEAARAPLYLAAAKVTDNAPDKTRFSAMAKRLATDNGSAVVDRALQLFCGYGYLQD